MTQSHKHDWSSRQERLVVINEFIKMEQWRLVNLKEVATYRCESA